MDENNHTSDTSSHTPGAYDRPASAFDRPSDSGVTASSLPDSPRKIHTTEDSSIPSAQEGSSNSAFSAGDCSQPDSAFSAGSNGSTPSTPAAGSSYAPYNNTYTSPYGTNDTIVSVPEDFSNGFGIASLILGIISIPGGCCYGLGILFSVLGIIFGILQKKTPEGKKPGTAVAGIICSVVGVSIAVIEYIILVLAIASSSGITSVSL